MRRPACLAATIVLLAAALLAGAEGAFANGDPPSDVLLTQDAYVPYYPKVSVPLSRTLSALLSQARKRNYPVKVALIASTVDLGSVPQLFGHPQDYARFLGQEIRFLYKRGALLIVMPHGFGVDGSIDERAASDALRPLKVRAGSTVDLGSGVRGYDSNSLARAAIAGVLRLASLAGKPLSLKAARAATVQSGSGRNVESGEHGGPRVGSIVIVLGLAGLIVLAALAGGALYLRRARAQEEQ